MFCTASALQPVELFDVDALRVAEQHDEDREADRGLGGGDRENEEHEHLAERVVEHPRERDEVEVHREQHELDAHQEQDHVLAVEEDTRDAQGEQDRREHEVVRCGDGHHRSTLVSTLTMRTRSSRRTATCFATSCALRPARCRIVSVIAATIASSRITEAISNAYTCCVYNTAPSSLVLL